MAGSTLLGLPAGLPAHQATVGLGLEGMAPRGHMPQRPSPNPAVDLLFGGDAAAAAIQRGQALALGALLARYLVEAPPNVCTPT